MSKTSGASPKQYLHFYNLSGGHIYTGSMRGYNEWCTGLRAAHKPSAPTCQRWLESELSRVLDKALEFPGQLFIASPYTSFGAAYWGPLVMFFAISEDVASPRCDANLLARLGIHLDLREQAA